MSLQRIRSRSRRGRWSSGRWTGRGGRRLPRPARGPAPGRVESLRVRTVAGVNLRDLAISGDGKELLIVHMAQSDEVPITDSNIDAGRVLSSRLSPPALGIRRRGPSGSAADDAATPARRPASRRGRPVRDGRHGRRDPGVHRGLGRTIRSLKTTGPRAVWPLIRPTCFLSVTINGSGWSRSADAPSRSPSTRPDRSS